LSLFRLTSRWGGWPAGAHGSQIHRLFAKLRGQLAPSMP
jgi:hypothetical protein